MTDRSERLNLALENLDFDEADRLLLEFEAEARTRINKVCLLRVQNALVMNNTRLARSVTETLTGEARASAETMMSEHREKWPSYWP